MLAMNATRSLGELSALYPWGGNSSSVQCLRGFSSS